MDLDCISCVSDLYDDHGRLSNQLVHYGGAARHVVCLVYEASETAGDVLKKDLSGFDLTSLLLNNRGMRLRLRFDRRNYRSIYLAYHSR